jgi:hypothetical protein
MGMWDKLEILPIYSLRVPGEIQTECKPKALPLHSHAQSFFLLFYYQSELLRFYKLIC